MDSNKRTTSKKSVYDVVTGQIISLLEQGTIPWQQPWRDAGIPQNLISKRPYQGINLLLLSSLGYGRNFFLTYDQVRKMNGTIRKGEEKNGNIVVFYTAKKTLKSEQDDNEQSNQKRILRYYRVWNVAQCELPKGFTLPVIKRQNDPIAACESILNRCPSGLWITHIMPEAFYDCCLDCINMPKRETFINSESYYDILFHEMIHWTGHSSRLNRPGVAKDRTNKSYSFEELIAQLGASFLSNHAGILQPVIENSAAYIAGWLSVFRNDKMFILRASAAAQRASDYILNVSPNDKSTVEQPEMITDEED